MIFHLRKVALSALSRRRAIDKLLNSGGANTAGRREAIDREDCIKIVI